jgi:hypothetical protein
VNPEVFSMGGLSRIGSGAKIVEQKVNGNDVPDFEYQLS